MSTIYPYHLNSHLHDPHQKISKNTVPIVASWMFTLVQSTPPANYYHHLQWSSTDLSGYLMCLITKKDFRLGGLAASEWTCSVRAIGDTPGAYYSALNVNTTRRVIYRPPVAISPFILPLSVSHCNQKTLRWSQLWPHVGMGSLCIRLLQDCNA
jgi:hypothetical protein